MTSSPSKPIVSPVLIGRASLTQALSQKLAHVRAGQGGVVLISGEAGIGKSRLVAEAHTLATQQGWVVQQGTCFESDYALPYAPLLDLVRSHFATEQLALLQPFAPEFVKLLPELSDHFPTVTPTPPLAPEQEKRRHFQTLARFLTSQPSPTLILIEDAHWCDDTSLDFLLFLARNISTLPVLLVVTYRSAESQTQPALRHFLAELDRTHLAVELVLARLSLSEVELLIRAIFEQSTPVRPEFVEAIYALTEGNPFFIEEILKSLISVGDISYANGEWTRKPVNELRIPRSIQDAVHRRTEQLSQPARQVLVLAAVTGRRFDFDLLQYLTQIDERELLEHIKALIAAQLVVEEATDQFAFRHVLTRQAVYAQLLGRERLTLHRSIAQALEHLYPSPDQRERRLGELAYHFFEAGLWAKALDYSRRAGLNAQAVYAPHAAIEHFTRALRAAHSLSASPPPDLHRARGLAYEVVGEFEPARADYTQALAMARSTADLETQWQALTDLGSLWASRDYEQAGEFFQEALALARQLNDPSALAHSLNRLGNWHVNVEQPQQGLHYHQEALAIFQAQSNQPGLAETLDLAGMACYLGCDPIQGTAYYQQAIALFQKLDNRPGLSSSLATLTMRAATYQTNLTLCPVVETFTLIHEQETALKVAQEIGWRSGEAYAQFMPSFALGARGDYARALALAQNGLAIAEEIEHRQWLAAAHCALGAIYLDLLAPQLAQEHLSQALVLAQAMGSLHWTRTVSGFLASLHVLQNDLAHAHTLLATTIVPDPPQSATLGDRLLRFARAELALAEGQPDLALQILDGLAGPELNSLRLSYLRGQTYAVQHNYVEAGRALEAALAVARAQTALPMQWRILGALAQVYQAQDRTQDSGAALVAATALIDSLAASVASQPLANQFREAALALLPAEHAYTPLQSAKLAFGGLTARERQVATLIAHGHSNREVAQNLVVSERTIEGHVSNILSKLGLASRAQVAVWLVEKGLT